MAHRVVGLNVTMSQLGKVPEEARSRSEYGVRDMRHAYSMRVPPALCTTRLVFVRV